jgi:hypothetical protein
MRFASGFGVWSLALSWLLCGPSAGSVPAQDVKAAARCTGINGALLMQGEKGQWTSVAAPSDVVADRFLVALFGADFTSPGSGVEARLVADVGQRGPFPVLEAAAAFHANPAVDLDLSLARGILLLTNTKKKGAVHVRLRVRGENFEAKLTAPKARLAIEVYGRHVPGPPNLSDAKADNPVANVAFFALAGETVIESEKNATRLQAPPGSALYLWDNVTHSADVVRFETLPDFAKPMSAEERKQFEAIGAYAKTWTAKAGEIGKALERAVSSREALERKAAVVALGALDDLPRLMQVLTNKEHADTRDMAILVLRHWLGRQNGQSIRLYDHLTKADNYTPIQAKNMLYLLHGIEEDKIRQPETYDLLVGALNHSKIATRELARWHLVRLAPDGNSIAYDAAGDEAQRRAAMAAWRKLIPEGQLPPPPKKKTAT